MEGIVCVNCGKVVRAGRERWCNHCGADFRAPGARGPEGWLVAAEAAFSTQDAVVVRVYPGRTQADAAALFAREARVAAEHGYSPVAQSWADGRPGIGRVMMIGELAESIRPKGALTVTYSKVTIGSAATDTKTCPMCAEEVKAAAKICRFCRYAFV